VVSAEDHLQQFAALGAILAFPDPSGRYHVFRNLTRRPPAGTLEDLSKMDRIWFIDQKPETVAGVVHLLGMKLEPAILIAFFPKQLEDDMAELEKGYRASHKGAPERIVFQVVLRAGSYRVVVADPQP